MKSHRRYLHRLRTAVVLALCVPLSASAGARADPPAGDTKADYPGSAPAPKIGDTPADFAQPVAPAPKAGDTPIDHPGASRAPEYDPPTTTTVNRPERTIVRDVDDALPTMLAGLALLIAMGGAGYALIRTRSMQRGGVGRSQRWRRPRALLLCPVEAGVSGQGSGAAAGASIKGSREQSATDPAPLGLRVEE